MISPDIGIYKIDVGIQQVQYEILSWEEQLRAEWPYVNVHNPQIFSKK